MVGGRWFLTDLRDVGRCRDGEGVSVESEADIRHALDVLAVHHSLWEEHHTHCWIPCGSRSCIYWYFTGFQLKQVTKSCLIIFIWEFWRQRIECLFTLGAENGENLLQMVWYDGITHISVFVGWGSNPGIHVADLSAWADDLGGTGVNDGLAATTAGHSLSIDDNTVRGNSKRWITVKLGSFVHLVLCTCLWLVFSLSFLCTCPFWSASRWQRSEGSKWLIQCSGCCQRRRRSPRCPPHCC